MRTSNNLFYEGLVNTGDRNRAIKLSDLPQVQRSLIVPRQQPLVWIDHEGPEDCRFPGQFQNQTEAEIVLWLLKDLIKVMMIEPKDIGIITGYNSQREKLVEYIQEDTTFQGLKLDVDNLLISTVDSFQGREREVIIYASTRSNAGGEIGFLKDERRFNVAVTRAKRCLIIIGSKQTLLGPMTAHLRAMSGTVTELQAWMRFDHQTSCFDRMQLGGRLERTQYSQDLNRMTSIEQVQARINQIAQDVREREARGRLQEEQAAMRRLFEQAELRAREQRQREQEDRLRNQEVIMAQQRQLAEERQTRERQERERQDREREERERQYREREERERPQRERQDRERRERQDRERQERERQDLEMQYWERQRQAQELQRRQREMEERERRKKDDSSCKLI